MSGPPRPERAGAWPDLLSVPTLIVVAAFSLAVHAAIGTNADPDLWGHLRFGADIVRSGEVPRHDPYSFTSDREWVNHEWLAEVIMASAWAAGGHRGLVLAKAAVVGLALWMVWWRLRRDGLSVLACSILLTAASAGVLTRTPTFRPQVFSLLLFSAMLFLLREHEERERLPPLWLLPPLFASWVNLHGGWIVGAGVTAFWAASRMVRADGGGWRRRVGLVTIVLASLVATLTNPYGVGMWRFLRETVGLGRASIGDWQPAWRVPAPLIAWSVAALLLYLAVVRGSGKKDLGHATLVVALGGASLLVNRLDAFFVLAAIVLLGPPAIRAIPSGTRQPAVATPESRASAPLAGMGIVAFVTLSIATLWTNLSCLRPGFGTEQPEPDVVRLLRSNGISGRMLSWYNYGEYLIWHLGPRIRVSMDGRRETVYSQRVIDAHAAFYSDPAGRVSFPSEIGAELIWLPNHLGAARPLEERGWTPFFRGPVSTVWVRGAHSLTTPTPRPGMAPHVSCFPGP